MTKRIISRALAAIGLLVLVGGVSYGQSNDPFKDNMTAMGKDFKTLNTEYNNNAFGSDALALAQDMLSLAQKALTIAPPTTIVDPSNKAAYEQFTTFLQDNVSLIQTFVSALQANDQTAALAAFGKISDNKQAGHDKFKPANN